MKILNDDQINVIRFAHERSKHREWGAALLAREFEVNRNTITRALTHKYLSLGYVPTCRKCGKPKPPGKCVVCLKETRTKYYLEHKDAARARSRIYALKKYGVRNGAHRLCRRCGKEKPPGTCPLCFDYRRLESINRNTIYRQKNAIAISNQRKKYRSENNKRLYSQQLEWREKNKDKYIATQKEYRVKNKSIIAIKKHNHYLINKTVRSKNARIYRESHKEYLSLYGKKYYQDNKLLIAKRTKSYVNKNKIRIKKRCAASYQRNKELFLKSDNYLARLVADVIGLKDKSVIPKKILLAKHDQLELRRTIKETKNVLKSASSNTRKSTNNRA